MTSETKASLCGIIKLYINPVLTRKLRVSLCLFNENEKLQRQRVSVAVKSAIGHILCLYIYIRQHYIVV